MATEVMEYRPGKWVKVIDGRIVGRATPEEVAAWRAQAGLDPTASPASMSLDIDLDLPVRAQEAGPARAVEVPLRPAFERRGRNLERPPEAGAGPAEPAPAAGRERDKAAGMTVEMAIAREAMARRRQHAGAAEASAAGTAMIRRQAVSLPEAHTQPAATAEVTSLPRPKTETRHEPPTATAAEPRPAPEPPAADKPAPARRAPRGGHRRKAVEAPAAGAEAPVDLEAPPEDAPLAEGPEPRTHAAAQSPDYWWICNAHHQPVDAFLKEWAPKYEARFGRRVTFVLCHAEDLAAVQACGFDADMSPLLQPGHFYLGHNGEEQETARKKAR